jgi:4'-phosphopantetheinyl transferase
LLLEKGVVYSSEPVIRNPWGKPCLKNYPNIHYNISHSADLVACVISDTSTVGIDVEKIREFNSYAANRVCSSEELSRVYSNNDCKREFFRYWTLKESYIKAIGKGISHPMKNVNFEVSLNGEVYSNIPNCSFLLMEDIEEYITAVCYLKISRKE